MESVSVIKVGLIGFDPRSKARIETTFKINFKKRCAVTEISNADVVILDIDTSQDALQVYQDTCPHLPVITMSETPVAVSSGSFVQKPAKLAVLWDSIFHGFAGVPTDASAPVVANTSSAAGAISSRLNKASSVTKDAKRWAEASLYFDTGKYFLGFLLDALEKGEGSHSICITCWNAKEIILLPSQDTVYTDFSANQLRNLAVVEFSGDRKKNTTVEVSKDERMASGPMIKGMSRFSMEEVLWCMAYRTSRGRVPNGTDLEQAMYLRCWPNFPQLPNMPNGMRIASLWSASPKRLDDIADQLQIETAEVYAFYTAALALSMSGYAVRAEDVLIEDTSVIEKKKTGKTRGLLQSILKHVSKQAVANKKEALEINLEIEASHEREAG